MSEKKLLVEFPGRNYSCDKPLLYYGGMIFSQRGYDVIRLDYNARLTGNRDDITGLIEESRRYVEEQLDGVDFSEYEDIVFLSKSMGTALAGYFESFYKIRVRHIYLTPVADALKYMSRGKCLVVSGKDDRYLDATKLKIYCVEREIPLQQFEGVGHSLECADDLNKTFAILMIIIRMYREF